MSKQDRRARKKANRALDANARKRGAKKRDRERERRDRKARSAEELFGLNRDNELGKKRRGRRPEKRDWTETERCFTDTEQVRCQHESCGATNPADILVFPDGKGARDRARALRQTRCPACERTGVLAHDIITPAELYARKLERFEQEEPTRHRVFERAFAWAIAWADEHAPGQTYPVTVRGHTPSLAEERRRGSQHPERIAKRLRKRQHPDLDPIERERKREVRHYERLVAENQMDGIGAGALRRAAELYVPQLQSAHDLPGEEHRAALTEYLVGYWGETLHAFPEHPALPSYFEWRARSRLRVAA